MFGEISYITKALVAVLQLGVTTDFSIFLYHSYESKRKESKTKEEAMSREWHIKHLRRSEKLKLIKAFSK